MDGGFSVDDIAEADPFWSPHAPPIRLPDAHTHLDHHTTEPPDVHASSSAAAASKMMRMIRSSSEWAFQQFLQEAASPNHAADTLQSSASSTSRKNPQNDDVVEIKDGDRSSAGIGGNIGKHPAAEAARGPLINVPVDSEEYQAYLKSRLELACAAVALTRATAGMVTGSAAAVAPDCASQASNSSVSHTPFKASGCDTSKLQDKDGGGPVGIPPLPSMSQKSGAQVKPATSGSSGDQSDDDEIDGENESCQNMNPADSKRMRRMLSNRESARRSRRRKQAHLTELETQVSQLKVENSSLLKRLTDISNKYNAAAVDNRVLKADVETLRAKVKMAEETVKRVTGLNPFFQAMSEISAIGGRPTFAGSPETSADAAVPVQDDQNQQYYHHHGPSNSQPTSTVQDHMIQSGLVGLNPAANATPAVGANKMGRTGSMQRVASLEHLQKRIRGASSSSSSAIQGGSKP